MRLSLLLTLTAAVAALSAAQGAPPPDLAAMAVKARVDGQLASWCRGQFRAGRRNAYAYHAAFATTVVCAFVAEHNAVCWQYSPKTRTFVEVGGWQT